MIAARRAEIESLRAAIDYRETQVAGLEAAQVQAGLSVAGRERQIAKLQTANAELAEGIVRREHRIIRLEATIAELDAQAARREARVALLEERATDNIENIVRAGTDLKKVQIFSARITKVLAEWFYQATGMERLEADTADLSTNVRYLAEYFGRLVHADKRLRQVSGNYRLYTNSKPQIDQETIELDRECTAMREEIDQSPEIYRPSKFWEAFYEQNMLQLREVGLSNFKLTVNQNYQNFIPLTLRDPKLRPLLRNFRKSRSIRGLLSYIENPDNVAGTGYLTLPGTQIFDDDPQRLAIYRTMVALGWDYCRANDPLNLCPRLVEPELGNPIRVHSAGKLISQDLATSVVEVTEFIKPWRDRFGDRPFSFLEIGAGYGRLAHAILSTQPVSRYYIVDIPPALHVSKWYLSKLFPEKRIFHFRPFDRWSDVEQEIERADIVFLVPHQIELIPDHSIDISATVSSLHEMSVEQANNYLSQMGRIVKSFIHSKQYYKYLNPHDNITFEHADYVAPQGFDRLLLRDDRLNPVFFVDTFERQDREAGR
jgi:putative sugar O-methyltransferase